MAHVLPTCSSTFNSFCQASLLSKKKKTLLCWHISKHTHTEGFPTLTACHFHSHSATQQPAVIKWSVNYRTTERAHTPHVHSHKYIYLHIVSVCVRERDRVHWPRAEHTWHKWIFSYSENNKSFNLLSDWEGHTHTHTQTCRGGQLEVRNHYVAVNAG